MGVEVPFGGWTVVCRILRDHLKPQAEADPRLYSFQHRITGAKSRTAEDFRGGLLADDMGLGKTLTALTLIVASFEAAAQFGAGRGEPSPLQIEGSKSPSTFSQATIVVVPSECKFASYRACTL